MLYYLFDITVIITNEDNQNSYRGDYLVAYPDGTEQKVIEADADHIMDKFADTCGADFCREFAVQDGDVQTDLDAYTLTEEQYNHYKEINEEGE